MRISPNVNLDAALRIVHRVFEIAERLADGEFDGREVQLATGEVLRTWYAGPVRIFYERTATELRIIRIYHHARRPLAR